MTYPIHSIQSLKAKTTTELKSIAQEIGAVPETAYGRKGYIDAIIDKQGLTQVLSIEISSTDELIEAGILEAPSYRDCGELEIEELLHDRILSELGVVVNQLDPDGGDGIYEIVRYGRFVAFVDGLDNQYDMRDGNGKFSSPEAAGVAWLEMNCPYEVLRVMAACEREVLDRVNLPDYF